MHGLFVHFLCTPCASENQAKRKNHAQDRFLSLYIFAYEVMTTPRKTFSHWLRNLFDCNGDWIAERSVARQCERVRAGTDARG